MEACRQLGRIVWRPSSEDALTCRRRLVMARSAAGQAPQPVYRTHPNRESTTRDETTLTHWTQSYEEIWRRGHVT